MTATEIALVVAGALLALVVLAHFKRSRPDGRLVERVHPYRRMMPFIMRTRTESAVYFDSLVRAEALEEYLEEAGPAFGADVTHCVVAAAAIGLAENPSMNLFVAGRRLYEREGRWLSFSVKRKKKDRAAKLGVVKMRMEDGETFRQLCDRIHGKVGVERSGERTGLDRELNLLGMIPRSGLRIGVWLLRALDYVNLLPKSFIEGDGMYCSAFLANLGSLEMGAAYHHLFEWGNCPHFVCVGAIEDRPIVEDGQVVAARVMPIRFSYDERIDDGLTARFGIDTVRRCLEDPRRWLGGLEADGTVGRPLWPHHDGGDDPAA